MDIFTPEGDTNLKKPAIILAHSGGFLLGNKNLSLIERKKSMFSSKSIT